MARNLPRAGSDGSFKAVSVNDLPYANFLYHSRKKISFKLLKKKYWTLTSNHHTEKLVT